MTLYLGTKAFSFFIRPNVFSKSGLITVGFNRNRNSQACMEDSVTVGARSDTLAEFIANEEPGDSIVQDGQTYTAKSIGWGTDEKGNQQKITYSAQELAARAKLRSINEKESELRRQKLDLEMNPTMTNVTPDVEKANA